MIAYSIQRSRVVYEVLNTEVIVIDFNTGNYYALLHVAKDIWQLIEKQIPLQQITLLIASHYKQDLVNVSCDIRSFIDQLLEAELIELCVPDESAPQIIFQDGDYIPPRMQTYTDVQNLLLIDPIHEVTEAGWPETSPTR